MTKEELIDLLPHGSGINGSWTVEERKGAWVAYNFYEPMTEAGYYDGTADFKLVIPKKNPADFKLSFVGREAQYLNRKHDLRGYLEDTFALALESMPPEEVAPKRSRGAGVARGGYRKGAGTPASIRGIRS